MLPPGLDDHLGFGTGAKPLDAQALVPKLAVEGLDRAILPRFTGVKPVCVAVIFCSFKANSLRAFQAARKSYGCFNPGC
jgi:hypothetical protein